MKFHGFYGNPRIKEYLSHAVDGGAVPHALLISGPEGIGKSTLGAVIARALVCRGQDRPCGACPACVKSQKDSHPDIIHIRRTEASIKVSEIRALKQDAYLRPNDGDKKVYIIHDADFMTQEAQDALLKILEEPPAFTVFLLLCYNEKSLLETVRSRCVRLPLAPLDEDEMLALLRDKLPGESDERLRERAHEACGVAGNALSQEPEDASESARGMIAAVASGDALKILEYMISIEKLKRDELVKVLDGAYVYLRDAMVHGTRGTRLMRSGAEEITRALYSRAGSAGLMRAAESISQARSYCAQNIGVAHITGFLACELSRAVRT